MFLKLRYLHRAHRYRRRVDPAEIRYVRQSLRPGQTAVDVGCHKGAYTYWMQKSVGPTGRVIAFEPQPRLAAYLSDLFAAMRFDNVTLVAKGVSSTTGQSRLFVPTTKKGGSHGASFVSKKPIEEMCRAVDVQVTTLDDWFADQPKGPDLLKIDTEGHELQVLKGAQQTIASSRPAILIECEARHSPDGDVQPVLQLLDSLGYEGSFFFGDQRLPLADFDPVRHQPAKQPGKKLPRGYVNIFVFEHRAA